MAQTPPPSLTAPPTAPSRSEPTTFRARGDAFLAWFATLYANLVAALANVYGNAVDAYNSAVSALASSVAAAASASASAASAVDAANSSGALAWLSGTTYVIGAKRWSLINGRVYVRLSEGAGTTDPANDPTNWADVVGGRRVRITGNTNAVVGCIYELDSTAGPFTVTLPASFAAQDRIGFVDVGLALTQNNVTVARNGNNIRRAAEDLVLDVNADRFDLVGQPSIGWIEE